jgi:hypothetical protein
MEDTRSVASGGSTVSLTNQKMECPNCKNEFQTRAMFNHIRKRHPGPFQEMTQKEWLLDAQSGKPLKVCWNKMNDFDEEETIIIYGCLATNKTFTTEFKAMAHFTKCSEALKDHKKEIKLMLKIRNDALKINQKEKKKGSVCTDPKWLKYKELREANDPTVVQQLLAYIEAQIKDAAQLYEDTQRLKNFDVSLLGKSVDEIHEDYVRIQKNWPSVDKKSYKQLSIIRTRLKDVIAGLEHVDGGINLESNARMYTSDWSEFF